MEMRVVGFVPPIFGCDAEFNTFRLGGFYAKHLSPGEEVLLLNEKDRIVFGRAVVERVEQGPLAAMLADHASRNHTQLADDPANAHERLYGILCKIYGPHIATPTKKTVVIYMRRLE